jgi:hypothetical protein
MIKNARTVHKFEKEIIRSEKVDILENFRLVEAMYNEAVLLGVLPLKDALSGLEIDLKIARVVNSVSKTS